MTGLEGTLPDWELGVPYAVVFSTDQGFADPPLGQFAGWMLFHLFQAPVAALSQSVTAGLLTIVWPAILNPLGQDVNINYPGPPPQYLDPTGGFFLEGFARDFIPP